MKRHLKTSAILLTALSLGMAAPQHFSMPVENATPDDFHPDSFWYHPWGRSGTHKGVDIFAREGMPVASATHGVVVFRGRLSMGGNVVLVLGPKWRLHYYAHLRSVDAPFGWVARGRRIGAVGTTGNAAGKPPHLHYSILSLFPYPWRIDRSPQGWKKMFYLDPSAYLGKKQK